MRKGSCRHSQAISIGEVIGRIKCFDWSHARFKGLIKKSFLCILLTHALTNSSSSKASRFQSSPLQSSRSDSNTEVCLTGFFFQIVRRYVFSGLPLSVNVSVSLLLISNAPQC